MPLKIAFYCVYAGVCIAGVAVMPNGPMWQQVASGLLCGLAGYLLRAFERED